VPAVPGRAPFSWLAPVIHVNLDALLPEVGLDAIFFAKFAQMVRALLRAFLLPKRLCSCSQL